MARQDCKLLRPHCSEPAYCGPLNLHAAMPRSVEKCRPVLINSCANPAIGYGVCYDCLHMVNCVRACACQLVIRVTARHHSSAKSGALSTPLLTVAPFYSVVRHHGASIEYVQPCAWLQITVSDSAQPWSQHGVSGGRRHHPRPWLLAAEILCGHSHPQRRRLSCRHHTCNNSSAQNRVSGSARNQFQHPAQHQPPPVIARMTSCGIQRMTPCPRS